MSSTLKPMEDKPLTPSIDLEGQQPSPSSSENNHHNNTTNPPTAQDANVTADTSFSRFTRLRMSSNFALFTVGLALFVDLVCYSIIMPLTPFLIEQMGMGASANGILVACYAAGLLVASFVVGYISDKMASRRIPMIVGLIALMLATVLFMESTNHYWVLILSRLAAGLAGGAVMTLGFSMLSDTFPSNQMGEQMGKALIGQTLGLMVGPPLGGALDENVGQRAPFVLCLILIGIDLLARVLIIEPRTAKVKQIRAFQKQQKQQIQKQSGDAACKEMGSVSQQQQQELEQSDLELETTATLTPCDDQPAGFSVSATHETVVKKDKTTIFKLLKHPRLLTALMVSFVQAFGIAALEPVLPLYLEREFHASKTRIGLIFLAMSIPTLTAPLAGAFSDKHGAKWMASVCVFVASTAVIVLGVPNLPLWAIIICLVFHGACSAAYLTPILGEISAVVRVTGDGDGFARAFGLFNCFFSLGMVAGPLLGAFMYEKTSMLWTMVLIGAITLAQIPIILTFMADKKQKLLDQQQYEDDMSEQDRVLAMAQMSKLQEQGQKK